MRSPIKLCAFKLREVNENVTKQYNLGMQPAGHLPVVVIRRQNVKIVILGFYSERERYKKDSFEFPRGNKNLASNFPPSHACV